MKTSFYSIVSDLLTPQGILAFILTIGMISMIMFRVEPPDYYTVVWSMGVGYFFGGRQIMPPIKQESLDREVNT